MDINNAIIPLDQAMRLIRKQRGTMLHGTNLREMMFVFVATEADEAFCVPLSKVSELTDIPTGTLIGYLTANNGFVEHEDWIVNPIDQIRIRSGDFTGLWYNDGPKIVLTTGAFRNLLSMLPGQVGAAYRSLIEDILRHARRTAWQRRHGQDITAANEEIEEAREVFRNLRDAAGIGVTLAACRRFKNEVLGLTPAHHVMFEQYTGVDPTRGYQNGCTATLNSLRTLERHLTLDSINAGTDARTAVQNTTGLLATLTHNIVLNHIGHEPTAQDKLMHFMRPAAPKKAALRRLAAIEVPAPPVIEAVMDEMDEEEEA